MFLPLSACRHVARPPCLGPRLNFDPDIHPFKLYIVMFFGVEESAHGNILQYANDFLCNDLRQIRRG